jgi:hypothetical protein
MNRSRTACRRHDGADEMTYTGFFVQPEYVVVPSFAVTDGDSAAIVTTDSERVPVEVVLRGDDNSVAIVRSPKRARPLSLSTDSARLSPDRMHTRCLTDQTGKASWITP